MPYGRYIASYCAFSVASFGASLVYLMSHAYDFLTLMQELTGNQRLLLLINFIFFCFLAWGSLSVRLIFRRVRIIEIEHIKDQLPFYTVSLVIILVNDSNLLLNLMWAGLTLLLKIHQIITFDRVDFLQAQVVGQISLQLSNRYSVFRTFAMNPYVLLLTFLLLSDIFMARILAYDVFRGVGSIGSLLFGIQFGVMGIECFSYIGKLFLNVYELMYYRCPSATQDISALDGDDVFDDDDDLEELIWEDRALYVQSFEVFASAFKAIFFLVFLFTLYYHSRIALPIPLVQGFIVSSHQTVKQAYQLFTYLKQSRHLHSQLKNATELELDAADRMCIICREDMHFPETFAVQRGKTLNLRKHPKKLRCGHILHLCCLKDWLERSDSCPLCREIVFQRPEEPNARPQAENIHVAEPEPVARPAPPQAATLDTHAPPAATQIPPLNPIFAQMIEAHTRLQNAPEEPEEASSQIEPSPQSATPDSTLSLPFAPEGWTALRALPTESPHKLRVQLTANQSVIVLRKSACKENEEST